VFNKWGTVGNWSWVPSVMEAYNNAGAPAVSGNKFINAQQTVRGRPVTVAGEAEQGFASPGEFQAALNKNREDPNLSMGDKQRIQRELIALRERTRPN